MLVGREAERAAIEQLCAGARVGQSGLLVITGEAGIGKTALLEHAIAHATGMRVLQAVGSAPEREVAFGGLLQLLRPVLHLLELIPAPQASSLAAALELHAGEPGDRFATGAATLSLLSRAADDQPLLVVVDDAHDLDQPSVDALVFAGRRLLTDRIAVVLAARADRLPERLAGLPHLAVAGLELEPASRLLAESAPGPVPAGDVVRRVHAATGGNPLAMLELVADVGHLERISPEVPVPVPEVVAAAFGRRAGRLPDRVQSVLLLAAVADGDLAVVAAAAPSLDSSPEDLVVAEEAGLVSLEPGRVRFRHPLVRSSVYAAAPLGRRHRAHLAVAQALPEADLERRTWHLSEAMVGFDPDLADDLERVARRASTRGAYAVAATALERAGRHTADPHRRAERLLAAGEQAWLAGQAERSSTLLDEATALARDPRLLAALDGVRGSVAAHSGSLELARDLLTDAARRLADAEPSAAARLLGDAVMACLWMGDVTGATRAAGVLEGLDDQRLDEWARVVVPMASGMAHVLMGEGGIDRIREGVSRVMASGRAVDDPRPGSSIVGVMFLRESGTGRELAERLVRELRARSAITTLPSLLLPVARDEATSDRWRQGASHYEECVGLAREVGHTTELAMALAGLAVVQARTGRDDACERAATEAMTLAQRHRIHLAQVWSLFALGDLALGRGRAEQALDRYRELDGTLDRIGLHDVDVSPGPESVEALLRVGLADEARRRAEGYHARADVKGQPWARARAERALAMLSPPDLAEERFLAALELHRGSPDVYEEARTRLAFGAALRRQRRRVDARPELRAAVATFERIGADPWADAAARELAATGEVPARRGDAVVDRLTAQELQVSRMLSEGRTIRETAASLFLSPKTVEYHLRKVYTKLGIHSRDELAAALGREHGDE